MKKYLYRIAIGAGTAGLIVAGAAAFSAFEAHVINVTAKIENALKVPTDPIEFGTVFPEEELNHPLTVAVSDSFDKEVQVSGVDYMIRQKPKCGLPIPGTNPVEYSAYYQVSEDSDGNFVCPRVAVGENGQTTTVQTVPLPLLCPFLSKHSETGEGDGNIDAFHGGLGPWTMANTIATQVEGSLSKPNDLSDTWNIDLVVPCFSGACAQDNKVPAEYQLNPNLEHAIFGCDLWVETTGIERD